MGVYSQDDRCYGIDISHHQRSIDWSKISPKGTFPISFMIIRATYGTQTLDRKFIEYWQEAKKIEGMTIGSYHYYLNYQDPVKQAEVFATQLQAANFDPYKNFYAIDVEDKKTKKPPGKLAMDLQKFLNLMNSKLDPEDKLGITPVIYTTSSYWAEYLGRQPSNLQYNLWVARYYKNENPGKSNALPAGKNNPGILPDGKTDYHIWQYCSVGSVDGIVGNVDLNVSTIAKIRSLLPSRFI